MKKFLAILIFLAILTSNSVIMTAAKETYIDSAGENNLSVPRIDINTENRNGASLLKSDGYVNAQIAIIDTDSSVLKGDVLFKVRGNSTALNSIPKKGFAFKFNKNVRTIFNININKNTDNGTNANISFNIDSTTFTDSIHEYNCTVK